MGSPARVPFRNVGLFLQFLGLLLTDSMGCQDFWEIALAEERSLPKICLLPRVTHAPSSNSGQLWRVLSASELPMELPGASLRLHCSPISLCLTLLLSLPSIGDGPRNTFIWPFCMLAPSQSPLLEQHNMQYLYVIQSSEPGRWTSILSHWHLVPD